MRSGNPPANTTTPLVTTPSPPAVPGGIINELGQLARLVGTWHNTDSSFSWNVMPLPQDNAQDNFILKNFPYFEEITFAQIPGNAPNRGGGFTQDANTLFYEQRVYFGPNNSDPTVVPSSSVNTLVHAENGSWLFLKMVNQYAGAFPEAGSPALPFTPPITKLPTQPASLAIAKQMSVPHGNSILAQGSVTPPADYGTEPVNPPAPYPINTPTLGTIDGTPPFQLNGQPLPDHGIPVLNAIPTYQGNPYGASKYNPSNIVNGIESNSNINVNIKLVDYVNANKANIKNYVHFKVSAPAPKITNITFETGHTEVIGYDQEFWLLNPGKSDEALMYYQNIKIRMTLASDSSTLTKVVDFDHPTSNVVLPVRSNGGGSMPTADSM